MSAFGCKFIVYIPAKLRLNRHYNYKVSCGLIPLNSPPRLNFLWYSLITTE